MSTTKGQFVAVVVIFLFVFISCALLEKSDQHFSRKGSKKCLRNCLRRQEHLNVSCDFGHQSLFFENEHDHRALKTYSYIFMQSEIFPFQCLNDVIWTRRMSPDSSTVPSENPRDVSSLRVNSKPALCIVISKEEVGQVNISRELWVCILCLSNCWNGIYSCLF